MSTVGHTPGVCLCRAYLGERKGESMFRIEMATDNAAFVAAPGVEIASILEGLAGEMASVDDFVGDCQGVLKDLNGNKVGMWQYIDETEGQEMHQDYNHEEDTVDDDDQADSNAVEAAEIRQTEADRSDSDSSNPGTI